MFEDALDLIEAKDRRYHRDAYLFVAEALERAEAAIAKASRGQLRQMSGQVLLEGIRNLALTQFGPMAPMVLEEWGIRSCRDFGQIVLNMVEIGLLLSSEEDCRLEFENGLDFDEAFRKPFLPPSKQAKAVFPPAAVSVGTEPPPFKRSEKKAATTRQ